MGRRLLNPENRKNLDPSMKETIWQRDRRLCRKCTKLVYMTRKPKGYIHHIDFDRTNNKETNLVLLCSNCHRDVHHFYTENRYRYIWEMELITGIECTHSSEDAKEEYQGYRYHYATKLINELEHERGRLYLPTKDVHCLRYLKNLKVKLMDAHKLAEDKIMLKRNSEVEEE